MSYIRPKIVLLGDSITERGFNISLNGWALQLISWFGVKADIINRGHSGYNTRIAMELLNERKEGWYHASMNEKPANLVVIFWGANDAALQGIQGISIKEYKERICQQIQKIKECAQNYRNNNSSQSNFTSNIILITPPPVYDDDWKKEVQAKYKLTNPNANDDEIANVVLDRNNKTTKNYADTIINIGKEYNCPVIDLYYNMQQNLPANEKSYKTYLCDGLHLSINGNNYLFKEIKSTLKKYIPELTPNNIKKDFLEWRDAISKSNENISNTN